MSPLKINVKTEIKDPKLDEPLRRPVEGSVPVVQPPINIDHSGNDGVLHSNPRVNEAARIFEEGELKHDIGRCKVCSEVRPVFHEADYVKPKLNDNDMFSPLLWSIRENGKCGRCHLEERNNAKRKNPCAAPKFSGIFTEVGNTDDVEITHNNMHFEKVPPYLQNLSNLETVMVSKINIITNITILKVWHVKR